MDTSEREGGDITAAHMIHQTKPSLIKQYYDDSTIFITGATGYLGKLLVEKLLRTCPNLKKIYVLIRPKKGKTSDERFNEYFESEVFNRLKRENYWSIQKVAMVQGDCLLPNLGLSWTHLESLVYDVNCIFHCASTMRFNEKLLVSTLTNVAATRDLVKVANNMHNLKSFIYISTVFAASSNSHIKEIFYDSPIPSNDLLTVVNTLKEEVLEAISPILIKPCPNTYTFTKLAAEDVIRREGKELPIAIVRPSIVIGTAKEPVSGWVENFNSANGVFANVSLGYIRTLHCNVMNFGDIVPADYVVNCMIVAAWDIAMQREFNLNKEIAVSCEEIPIYNYVSTPENSIRWSTCIDIARHQLAKVPLARQIWHIIFIPQSSKFLYLVLHYLLHLAPAALLSTVRYLRDRDFRYMQRYKKIGQFLDGLGYFTSQQWYFKNNNTQKLWKKLNDEDKKCFEFSMKALDWDFYFFTYVRGLRVYLFQDPLETIPEAKIDCYKLKVVHYTFIFAIFLIIGILIYFVQ